MAYQTGIVTRNKRLFPNQTAELNARLPYLNDILSQQSEREYQAANIKNMNAQTDLEKSRFGLEQQQFGLEEKRTGLAEQEVGIKQAELDARASEQAWSQKNAQKQYDLQKQGEITQMGIKGAGLGATLLGSKFGDVSLGGIMDKGKTQWDKAWGNTPSATPSTGGFWSDLPVGSMVGGGLVGFGASRLGGKNKGLKALFGSAGGALAGGLTGGWQGAAGGGLLGGLGGLF